MAQTVNLVVVGLGEGTYKKLAPAIALLRPDDFRFRIAYGIDIRPPDELHPKMRQVMEQHDTHFIPAHIPRLWRAVNELKRANSAAIVMTPNDSHIQYGWEFAERGFRTLVEKPPGVGPSAVDDFLKLAASFPQRIYSGEYCVDGKALGLLYASGAISQDDPRVKYLTVNSSRHQPLIVETFRTLGKLKNVAATMLEGQGTAKTADHRTWLFDGRQGGMIRDLSSHLFGPVYESGLVTATVVDPKVSIGIYNAEDELGKYRTLTTALQGEMYAEIEGKFITGDGRLVPFSFKMGKYQPNHDRGLRMEFENGEVTLDYEPPFACTMTPRQGSSIKIEVHQDHYALCLVDFVTNFMARRKGVADPGHIRRGTAIVQFNETMRFAGLQQAGLV